MVSPPSSRIPTSNETRVRVEGLEKISAQVCPASGWAEILPRLLFTSAVLRKIRSISSRESCSILSKCLIFALIVSWPDRQQGLQSRAILLPLPRETGSTPATTESQNSQQEP